MYAMYEKTQLWLGWARVGTHVFYAIGVLASISTIANGADVEGLTWIGFGVLAFITLWWTIIIGCLSYLYARCEEKMNSLNTEPREKSGPADRFIRAAEDYKFGKR